jgi:hypothetical protein
MLPLKPFAKNKFYHDISLYFVCLLVCLVFFSQPASGGELGDLEQDATKGGQSEDREHGYGDNHNDDCWDSCFDELFEHMVWDVLEAGWTMSWNRAKGIQSEEYKTLKPRHSGEALIPVLRVDAEYQNVKGDVSAYDIRCEAGYGPIGLQVRNTHYREKSPADKLNFLQIQGLYRMSVGNKFEIDLGFGSSNLYGKKDHSGPSLSTSILVHPNEVIGFELRQSWTSFNANELSDYDFGMDLKYKRAALRMGYRWVRSEHESLNGPYVGISFRL